MTSQTSTASFNVTSNVATPNSYDERGESTGFEETTITETSTNSTPWSSATVDIVERISETLDLSNCAHEVQHETSGDYNSTLSHFGFINVSMNDTSEYMSQMDVLGNYELYHVALRMYRVTPLIFASLATIGNVLSLLVMLQSSMRKNSSCVYLAALAVIDTLLMYVVLLQNLSLFYFEELRLPWACKWLGFGQSFTGHCSVLFIVAVTIERYLAISYPFKALRLCTPKKALICIVALTLFCFGLDMPYFWITDSVYTGIETGYQCRINAQAYPEFLKVYSWIDISVYAFIPCVTLFAFNSIIIVRIRKAGKAQKQMTIQQSTRERINRQLTIMLLTVSTLFLICMIPNGIFYIIISSGLLAPNPVNQERYVIQIFVKQILYIFIWTNHSCNFFFYCLSGGKFRKELYKLLRCSSFVHRTTTVTRNRYVLKTLSGSEQASQKDKHDKAVGSSISTANTNNTVSTN